MLPGQTFAWLKFTADFPELVISALFRHYLGMSGGRAKSAEAFSRPRLILDHAGNKICRLEPQRFECEFFTALAAFRSSNSGSVPNDNTVLWRPDQA
jgi:hypothetical protein